MVSNIPMVYQLTVRSAILLMSFVLLGPQSARAGVIHAQAGVDGGFAGESFEDYWRQGMTSASAGSGAGEAWGEASVALLNSPGLRFLTQVDSEFGSQGQVNTQAQWLDVIRVTGQATVPDQIRIHLHLDAIVDLSIPDVFQEAATARLGISNWARFGAIWKEGAPGNDFQFDSEVALGIQRWGEDYLGRPIRDNYFISHDLQNLQTQVLDDDAASYFSSIRWDTTFDLPYDSTLGGYSLNLLSGAQSTGYFGGESRVNALNTMRLTNVTLTNGDPLSGSITFDSGYTLANSVNPVPEPSSMTVLLGLGGCLGVFYAVRRRRSTASLRDGKGDI